MASNKELIDEAEALSRELGLEVPRTQGLGNTSLTELVAGLRERRDSKAAAQGGASRPSAAPAGAPPPPAAKQPRPPVNGADDGTTGGPPQKAAPKPAKTRFPYAVAPGKSLTTRRGVLGPGAEIRPADVADGEKQLEHLVGRGYVVKGPAASKS